MSHLSCRSLYREFQHLPPTIHQLQAYTGPGHFPIVEKVEFLPSLIFGGHKAIRCNKLEQAQEILRDRKIHHRFRMVKVRFIGDRTNYKAKIEYVLEKSMLVVEDLGVLCSVAPDPI